MLELDINPGLLKDTINALIVQLDSPFYSKFLEDNIGNHRVYSWKPRYIGVQREKIKNILKKIKDIYPNERIHVIVFPEYTIPVELIEFLKKYADENNTIIVAGSHLVTDKKKPIYDGKDMIRQNVCPIIFPKEYPATIIGENRKTEIKFIRKKNLTQEEQRIGVVSGKDNYNQVKIRWEFREDSSLHQFELNVVLCRDYIDFLNPLNITNKHGIIIVPMCSEKTKEFYCLAGIHMRYNKFILLCNAISSKPEKGDPKMEGNSGIVGADVSPPEDNIISKLSQ